MARRHRLGRHQLYIFPTRIGFVFCGLVAVLWMLGTNYQNNLILAICLLLASLFVLTILRTHANLSGLEIGFHDADAGFAEQEVAFHLNVVNHSRRYKDTIQIAWRGEVSTVFAIDAHERKRIAVCTFASQRGYLIPGRLMVETIFPLGLLRCWTWLNVEARTIVYPKPLNLRNLQPQGVADTSPSARVSSGVDEFAGLRSYRVGDPLKQVAWKHYAREKGLMTKEFNSSVSEELWLTWESTEGLDTEQRLSTLCYWVQHYQQLGISCGLSLPAIRISPALSPDHKHQMLAALATFNGGGEL